MDQKFTLDELPVFTSELWKQLEGWKVIAFHGELGAGKTTTIAALCRQKGINEVASSPTFSIINEYSSTGEGEIETIYHIDLYRLKDTEEAIQAGVDECLASGSICFVEWPEKAPALFGDETLHVFIEKGEQEQERRVRITR